MFVISCEWLEKRKFQDFLSKFRTSIAHIAVNKLCIKTAFTLWGKILKTVKNVTESRPVQTKMVFFCRHILKNGNSNNGSLSGIV